MKPHVHDDSDPLTIPRVLCRLCHPELTTTSAQVAAAEALDRQRRTEAQAAERQTREFRKARRRLAGLTRNGEPDPESVNGRIARAVRAKLARLEATGVGVALT